MVSGGLIVATNALDRRPFTIALMGAEGWDTPPEFERTKKKRLWGDGDLVGRTTTFSGKSFSVSLFTQFPESSSIRGLRTNANIIAARLNDPVTCEMVYYQNEVEVFREKLLCLPDSPFMDDWNPVSNGVEFKLNFYAPDPWKTVYQNGSTTPSAQKRL